MKGIRISRAYLLLFCFMFGCSHMSAPPGNRIPKFQILTTESPFHVAVDGRAVLDRADVAMTNNYAPRIFQMKTPGSGQPTRVAVTTSGRTIQIRVEMRTDEFDRSILLSYPVSLVVEGSRLWLNPSYIHLDAARSCFASAPAPPPSSVGEIWIGSLKATSANMRGPGAVLEGTKRAFIYNGRRGTTELCALGGKHYVSAWTLPSEGARQFGYTSQLLQGRMVLFDYAETVTAKRTDVLARAVDRYYEVDES